MTKAVILFSGGQDSTTCLFWALAQGWDVIALSVNYGQRHAVELEAASAVWAHAVESYADQCIAHRVLEVPAILGGTSPLVSGETLGQYDDIGDLPGGVEPTFVPMRNALFLTIAANVAAVEGAEAIVTGVSEEDFGGYPDCREAFIGAAGLMIDEALDGVADVHIFTPLLHLDKRESVDLAVSLEGCMDAMAYSHTCYAGEVPPCGRCHACHLRARGFEQAGVPDPLVERTA